jgi:hypothetical protein
MRICDAKIAMCEVTAKRMSMTKKYILIKNVEDDRLGSIFLAALSVVGADLFHLSLSS